LAAAEKAAAVAEYIDQARRLAQILGQLVPANEKLASMQTRDLPLLSLPEWGKERWEAWQREYLAFVEPKTKPEPDTNTLITFIKAYSPRTAGGRPSGRLYNEGEGAAFPPEQAAEIVATGYANFTTPTPANARLVEVARHKLAAVDPTAGLLGVDLGWR
jgi:hypothetical protein